MRWAEGGPKAIFEGDFVQDLFDVLGDYTPLTLEDLHHDDPQWKKPLQYTLNAQSRILTPPLPSQGGVQIKALIHKIHTTLSLNSTLHQAIKANPYGMEAIQLLSESMQEMEQEKGALWPKPLIQKQDPHHSLWKDHLGFTTHLSTFDREGTCVGITSSLGETAGLSVGKRGLLLNNFLGETDVAPPHCLPNPGERLFTMCSPTLVESQNQKWILGTGGSSQIRSIITQGIAYLLPEIMPLNRSLSDLVQAPRVHWEDGCLRVETQGRDEETYSLLKEEADQNPSNLILFEGDNLYFGGLHITGMTRSGLEGGGDSRRSGQVRFA
jgi:gamma-glutamyltranspeptidase/glutathione hydrolase